jgi:hypothetical protein
MIEHMDELIPLGPEVQGDEDGPHFGYPVVGFYILITVDLKDGDSIAFVYSQTQKRIGKPVCPFTQLAKGESLPLKNYRRSIRANGRAYHEKFRSIHISPPIFVIDTLSFIIFLCRGKGAAD